MLGVCVMLPDFAFFPQLFSPAKIVVAYSSDKPTPGSFADSANQYALAHPSLNAFSITSFNYSVEAPGCGDDASGVSAAAPGTLWNSNALDNYPPYASPPPCEGSYVRITTMGPLPLFPLGCYTDFQWPEPPPGQWKAPDNPNWYKGQDFSGSRAFPYVQPHKAMTVEGCAAIAAMHGSPYFGLEKGMECWYGTSVTQLVNHVKRFGAADASRCNIACVGNAAETCGGKSSLSLYAIPQVASAANPAYLSTRSAV
ncbi:MAG: hypothetical protein WDW36_007451 [Sanguina aurantia]